MMTVYDPSTVAVMVPLGVLLMVAGRRLFWVVIAALGAFGALALGGEYLPDSSRSLLWGSVALACLAGAVVAIIVQRMAVALGGFVLGAVITHQAMTMLWGGEGGVLIVGAILGGVLGSVLAFHLFEVAVELISAGAGALLLVTAARLPDGLAWLVFWVLVLLGWWIQRSQKSVRRS
jgi:hypothetical protein